MFCLSTVSTNDYIKITGISFSKKPSKRERIIKGNRIKWKNKGLRRKNGCDRAL